MEESSYTVFKVCYLIMVLKVKPLYSNDDNNCVSLFSNSIFKFKKRKNKEIKGKHLPSVFIYCLY